jgi:para-aminobenzoate N-oxygenase AurF
MKEFNLNTTTQEPGFETAMQVIYQWDYDPAIEELRNLYVKATEAQWIAAREIDWDRPIDRGLFAETPIGGRLAVEKTSYWRQLDPERAWEATRRTAAFRLSNFLHGEQGALMVAAQLVNAVPHTDAKFYAATQTMDEARHVEVFARYIEKLDTVHPIAPPLKQILDATLATDDWLKKLVGMQIVVEGLALYSFREMRQLTKEPLLRDLLTYVARDESRHHAYGVQYIERCIPFLSARARTELEDFALEAARTLVDNRRQQGLFSAVLRIWGEAGLDTTALFASLTAEREQIMGPHTPGQRLGPVQGFVIPTLRRCGLLSERVAEHYHEFLRANLDGRLVGQNVEEFLDSLPELPADTLTWALAEFR